MGEEKLRTIKIAIKMKETIRFITIAMLSAVIAGVIGYIIADTLEQFAAIFFLGGAFLALVMGAFDVREKARYDSIKHKYGYRKAA